MLGYMIEMTIFLTVTALFVLIFKRVFKSKLSARWQLWLWALLFIRFLVPSLPESSVSVFNALPAETATYEEALLTLPETSSGTDFPEPMAGASADPKDIILFIRSFILVGIWAMGAVLLFAYFL
ncbi:MAG: hypothetical protein E7414_04515, partial [Ruminococcaceae bacterium]|nr:hypothetical protein [Oscillospiraceae bacterium]